VMKSKQPAGVAPCLHQNRKGWFNSSSLTKVRWRRERGSIPLDCVWGNSLRL